MTKSSELPSYAIVTAVAAHREYDLRCKGRGRRKVILEFGLPVELPDGTGFCCAYRITGLEPVDDGATPRYTFGADGVQALISTMQLARTELDGTLAYRDGRLTLYRSRDLLLPGWEALGKVSRSRTTRTKRAGTLRRRKRT